MKRIICVALAISVVFIGGCSQATTENDTPEAISFEVTSAITTELEEVFAGYSYSRISVFGNVGALDISLHCEGMVSQAMFSDYAMALASESLRLADENDLSIHAVKLIFSRGEDEFTTWTSDDCIVGTLADNYGDDWIVKSNQSIDDLVDRYGTMNWFS